MSKSKKYTCTVVGCSSPTGVSYHRYPFRDRDLYIRWLRLVARTAGEITHNSRICQIHFQPEDFQQNTERRMLHRWAYPSQNLPPPFPEDADLGLVEPLSSVSISEDSSLSEFVGTNTDEDSNQSNRRSVPSRRAKDRSLQFRSDLESSSFLGEFNPGTSEREKRKLTTKKKTTTVTSRTKPPIFDEKGILIHFQKDLCDCLVEECQGCHFPCPKCRSCKCGHECRQNRKWQFENLEIDGYPENQLKSKFIVPKQ